MKSCNQLAHQLKSNRRVSQQIAEFFRKFDASFEPATNLQIADYFLLF